MSTEQLLEIEEQTYQEKLSELLKDGQGKFVVISGATILGTYVAYEDALQEGYEHYGLKPFLVKKITTYEPIHFISQPLPCLS